jgi:hypothetical protein
MRSVFILQYSLKSIIIMLTFGKIIQRFIDAIGISYRNYSFVMELKHCYFAYRNANAPRQEISNKFNKCIAQLKSIKKEECRNLSINKGMIRIALQMLVFYRSSQNELSNDDLEEQDFEDDFEQLIQNSSSLEIL